MKGCGDGVKGCGDGVKECGDGVGCVYSGDGIRGV